MKKLIALLSLVLTLGLVGCSSKSEVKDIPVSDIKSAINNETLLPIQPISDIDAKEFYVFENVKDDIKEEKPIIEENVEVCEQEKEKQEKNEEVQICITHLHDSPDLT